MSPPTTSRPQLPRTALSIGAGGVFLALSCGMWLGSCDATVDTSANSSSGACGQYGEGLQWGTNNPDCSLVCASGSCSCESASGAPCVRQSSGDGSAFCRGCAGAWLGSTQETTPWWAREALTECRDQSAHCPVEVDDDCLPLAGGDNLLSAEECGAPGGVLVCEAGRWAVTCKSPADCPGSMVCVENDLVVDQATGLGRCRQRCDSDASTTCARCDTACRPAGYCAGPVELACGSDCECPQYHWCVPDYDHPGVNHCYPQLRSGHRPADYCAVVPGGPDEATCSCSSGICRPDGCCEVNGEVVNHESGACN
jgi:hypothetical protein